MSEPDAQERLEAGALGRRLISVLVILTLASLAASAIRHPAVGPEARTFLRPFTALTGLDQHWGVFSPNPRQRVLHVEARLHHVDGDVEVWNPPIDGPWLSPYRDYRWHKLFERLGTGRNAELVEPVARWVARTQADPEHPLRAVELVVRQRDIPSPGAPAGALEWTEESLGVVEVDP